MRILLSLSERKRLYSELKLKYRCFNIAELSSRLNISSKTLDGWMYNKTRYIPREFIEKEKIKVRVLDEREDHWWSKIGGREGYKAVLRKYGSEGVRKHRSAGGANAALTKLAREKELFDVDLTNTEFLELYGALLGDGWISSPNQRNKWTIGLCGHRSLDKDFILLMKLRVKNLFKREGFLNENPKHNVISFLFSHQLLVEYLHSQLNFPIGRKEHLQLPPNIMNLSFGDIRYVIRGIFDTDGSFHLEKNKKGERKYPCLSIHMKEPILMSQIVNILRDQGFTFYYDPKNHQLRLKGHKQLSKWMKEIGSSNPKHLNKIALVAQPG